MLNRKYKFVPLFVALTVLLQSENAQRFTLYVTNERSGDLTEIDSTTMQVIATIPLGKRPRGIHPSPDGHFLYIALSGSPLAGPGMDESKLPPPDHTADGIGVFDVRQNKLIRIIPCGTDPENFDVTHDGRTLIVSNEDAGKASFVDISSGKIIRSIAVGEEPEGVQISPDGKLVYVTSENQGTVSVIDVNSAAVLHTIQVGHRPRSVAFLPDGTRAYVSAENDAAITVIDTAKHEAVQAISLGQPGVIKPMMVLLSSDGGTLYVSAGRGHKLFAIEMATNRISGSLELGERPWGIAVSPDGKMLFSANGPSNDVSVVDLHDMKVTKKIKVGDGPWGVVALPR